MIEACWIQHGGEQPWAEQVATFLADFGIRVRFVSTIAEFHYQYQEDGFESHFIPEVFGWDKRFSPDELAALDMKYGPPGLQAICDSDVHLRLLFGNRQAEKEQIVARAYRFWEKFFDEYHTDYLIMRDVGSFATRTAYNIGRVRGRPLYMVLNLGPTDQYMTMCDVGESWIWRELLEAVSEGFQPLNDEQRELVWQVLQDRTAEKHGLAKLRSIPRLRHFPSRFAKSWLSERKYQRMGDPIGVAWQRHTRQVLLKRMWWRHVTFRLFPYDHAFAGEKYAYFPLYFEREWTNLVGPHFWARNMLPLIKEIALSLPAGYQLYVKEHPAVPGEMSLLRLWNIRRIPNVKIVHPLVQNQSLILNSAAVVILLGSSGWEAFLLRRPVVVIGKSMYTLSDLVYKAHDISDLSEAIWEAITKGDALYTEREEEWLWFIHRAIVTSAPVNVYNVEPPYFSRHNPDNSRKLAAAIAEKMLHNLQV